MSRNDGMTMIEITVILAVLGLLVGLVATAAGDLLEQSHAVRTGEEVDRIGRAIVEFYADTGYFPRTNDRFDGRPGDQEIGALISAAQLPRSTASTGLWVESDLGLLAEHLTYNGKGYRVRNPIDNRGWAGPYLPQAVGEDGWAHAYIVNVFWLDVRNVVEEADGTRLGAVWVLSAGPNGIIETPYYQPRDNARLYGDDIGFRLQ